MKNLILVFAFIVSPFASFAATTIPSSDIQIAPANIDKVVRLVDKNQPGWYDKKLQIVVTDDGMSTDVSPRYVVYLAYASFAEMGNITANFALNDKAIEFLSASRKSAGVYEVKVKEYREDGMYEVTQEINATAIFSDEIKMRKQCGEDFCDGMLKTSITVKETAKKL